MDMQELMDNFGSGAAFEDLTVFGPVSQRVAQRSPNTDVARSMIANNFWRAFIKSDSFPRALEKSSTIYWQRSGGVLT